MKNINARGKLKYLFIAIPVLLCAVIISLALFLPKDNNFSNEDKNSSDKTINASSQLTENFSSQETDMASSPQSAQNEEKPVKYRLIYSKENSNYDQTLGTPSKSDNLVNGYLKKIVSEFEGQDVYFRALALPTPVIEVQEEYDEMLKQRMEYIKEIGATDISEANSFSYYITVNAEMINKIGEAGGCYLYLAAVPNPKDYPDAEDNIIIINVTEDMKIPL